MDAGAFNDDKVVEASKKLVSVYVDCTDKGAHGDLKKKFAIKGYPTIKFLDADGKVLEDLKSRDAGGVAAQIDRIAEKHTKKGEEKKDDGKKDDNTNDDGADNDAKDGGCDKGDGKAG